MSYIDDKGKAVGLLKRIIENTEESQRQHSEEFARRVSKECSLWPKISAHAPDQYRAIETDSGLVVMCGQRSIEIAYSTPWHFTLRIKGLNGLKLLKFYINAHGQVKTEECAPENEYQGDTARAEAKLVFYENGVLKDKKEGLVKDISEIMSHEARLRQNGFLVKKENEESYYCLQKERNDVLIEKYAQKDYFLALVQITRDPR